MDKNKRKRNLYKVKKIGERERESKINKEGKPLIKKQLNDRRKS